MKGQALEFSSVLPARTTAPDNSALLIAGMLRCGSELIERALSSN